MTSAQATFRGVLASVLALAACRSRVSSDTATWFAPAPAPPIVGLDVVRQRQFTLQNERGKVVLLSFGYTSCLELCPDTFATARRVLALLGPASDRTEFVYVTVDPERDLPAPFARFISNIDPRFIGVYAHGEALSQILTDYHVATRKRLPDPTQYAGRNVDPAQFYTMDHTSGFWLIDRTGQLRVHFEHAAADEEILRAARSFLRGGAA